MHAAATPSAALRAEVAAHEWYHTLELAPGIVTPGWLDTRKVVGEIPFPASLAGKRCLDVGTFDGYWAFEMERRGAAEVVAIDILDPRGWDWPAGSSSETLAILDRRKAGGAGFEVAKRELGSSVLHLDLSVYDLDADQVGTFDVVYLGSLLVHLRDPVGALERVRDVCSGTLIVVDGVDLVLSLLFRQRPFAALDGRGRPWWWYPNAAGLARMIEAAGFDVVSGPRHLYIPPGEGQQVKRFDARLLRHREGRRALFDAWRGDPHAIVVAHPRQGLGPA